MHIVCFQYCDVQESLPRLSSIQQASIAFDNRIPKMYSQNNYAQI